ncbi:hypothetical protein EMCG_07338 [[Emmonsia] crescens]|uniref:Uncharacterized protein n=1 Tax=[Emmonsia] crescens TaxID=73230 RepID=A0A0G2J5R3_9EURO|nr:hypothetical protein EMCG_07338 [Emmonsia crescens UAMH 3008]
MALTQPMSPPSRQPFGVIDPSRLRFLQSAKNQQNGITAPSLKRRLETSDLSDSENVDPSSPSGAKRTRNSLDEDVSKTTKTTKTTTRFTFAPPPTPKRLHQTPLSQIIKRAPLPNSAPLRAPAGRSPKSKPAKAFSRRSIGSSYTRIDPPSFTKPHAAPRAPFSIADALHGTLNNTINTSLPNVQFQSQSQYQTHTQTLQATRITALDINNINSSSSKRHPKVWDFEIYADTEQDEMANLMEHSTCVLDISDDEDKSRNKDDRGKENIPPPSPLVGFGAQRVVEVVNYNNNAAAADGADGTSRNVEMTDNEPRAALGELDVAHFVSVSKEEVEEDEDEDEEEEKKNENENERENAANTIDPTAIPLPPPTAQEEESSQLQSLSQSQEEKEKPAGSESEACEIIVSASSTSSSTSSSSSSQPQPSSSNDTYHHYHYHYHHHQQQQVHQNHYQNKHTLASHAAISALISSTAPVVADTTATTATATSSSFLTGNEIEIEIWESGSAADEAEAEA